MKNINNLSPQQIKNGIVVFYINLFFRAVSLKLNQSIIANLGNATRVYLWSLTSNDETDLLSLYMNLNGVKLQLDEFGKVPNLNGKLITNFNVNGNDKINITLP